MIEFKRSEENPVLRPNPDNDWEAEATFNGCPTLVKVKLLSYTGRCLYRLQ